MEQEEPTLQNFAEALFTPLGDHFVTSVGMYGGTLAAPSNMKTRVVLAYTMSQMSFRMSHYTIGSQWLKYVAFPYAPILSLHNPYCNGHIESQSYPTMIRLCPKLAVPTLYR
jgi:hypothetical protein